MSNKGGFMTRKLGGVLLVLSLGLTASAAVNPATISGYVKNSGGVPQMGAAVEVLTASAAQELVTYTDVHGHYRVRGLLPGTYTVKVSAPSYLPTIREKVGLQSGANMVVNVTLNTLFEAIQLVPKRGNTQEDQDDWRWTLRSMANRPILRLADDGLVVVRNSDNAKEGVLKAQVSFLAGTNGEAFSGSDMSTNIQFEQSLFGNGTLSFNGDLGYANGMPSAFRASYSHQLPNGSRPEVTLTAKRFATPDLAARHAALQALALSMANTSLLTNFLEMTYGGQLETVQFSGRATAFRPFGSADLHLGENTVVEYRYATSLPNMRRAKGFDSAPADLSESGPRVSLLGFAPQLERASHNELSISHRYGKNKMQIAAYRDVVRNVALTGVGQYADMSGDIVPDVYSGTFLYNGGTLRTSGVRAVYQRKLFSDITGTVDYSYGGVLTTPDGPLMLDNAREALRVADRNSLATKVSGIIPGWKTTVLGSYRWVSGTALTPVDMFNSSPGQSDPYLSFFIRQPIPARRFIPNGMEALIDLRNLLAEGYRPVLGSDGHTMYLVQTSRSIRGGLAFTF